MTTEDESGFPFARVTVIGLGLIGGSLAMAIKERFPDVQITGSDPKAEALQYALKSRVIDQANLELPTRFEPNELIILSAHLTPNLEILKQLAPHVKGQSVTVMDIGSCKREIAALGRELLPDEFIPAHPMAGKELSGIENATSLLFAGKSFLFCPHAESDPVRVEKVTNFAQGLGGVPRLIDAEKHDKYMAYVSHLPQLYAILLTNLLYRHEPGHLLAYHGGGLDDQLRLAASPYGMWGDVFARNSDQMRDVLTEMREMIDEVLPILDPKAAPAGSQDSLEFWFNRANEVHRQFHAMKMHRR